MKNFLKNLLLVLAIGSLIGAVIAFLFEKDLIPFGDVEDEEDEDDLDEFEEDLSDLFDDFQDDVPVIRLDAEEEEAPAQEEETPAEETPAEE